MVRWKSLYTLTFIILIFIVSCKPAQSVTLTPQVTEVVPTGPASPTDISAAQPTDTPAAQPTDTPIEATKIPTTNPEPFLPNGVATYEDGTGSVKYFDLQGNLLGEVPIASTDFPLFTRAVIASTLSSESSLPPVIYYVPSGELWISEKDRNEKLVDAPNLLHIYGAPGEPFLTYTLAEYNDSNLRSLLYLSDIQSLPSAQPIMDSTSTEASAIKPLAISFNAGQPIGVWYTNVPNGIGGDIVFEPRRGLNYYDLATRETKSYLDMVTTPLGISPDQTWVAYSYAEGVSPVSIAHNFDFSNALTFPLREDSDRGAGEVFFSPDNQYVAWREVGGSLTGTPVPIHAVIRIAKIDGNILAEIPDTALLNASGFSTITWVTPLGWLDKQTIAVQIWGDTEKQAVISMSIDGSQISTLAPGALVGFLYP